MTGCDSEEVIADRVSFDVGITVALHFMAAISCNLNVSLNKLAWICTKSQCYFRARRSCVRESFVP